MNEGRFAQAEAHGHEQDGSWGLVQHQGVGQQTTLKPSQLVRIFLQFLTYKSGCWLLLHEIFTSICGSSHVLHRFVFCTVELEQHWRKPDCVESTFIIWQQNWVLLLTSVTDIKVTAGETVENRKSLRRRSRTSSSSLVFWFIDCIIFHACVIRFVEDWLWLLSFLLSSFWQLLFLKNKFSEYPITNLELFKNDLITPRLMDCKSCGLWFFYDTKVKLEHELLLHGLSSWTSVLHFMHQIESRRQEWHAWAEEKFRQSNHPVKKLASRPKISFWLMEKKRVQTRILCWAFPVWFPSHIALFLSCTIL